MAHRGLSILELRTKQTQDNSIIGRLDRLKSQQRKTAWTDVTTDMRFAKLGDLLLRLTRPKRRAIILGTGYDEYRILRKLEDEKHFEVLFFIDDEPWNHRTRIGNAELRYPKELAALCRNHKIDTVFFCDEEKATDLPELRCEVTRIHV